MEKKKILVIDDEQELVKAVEVRLKASGYEVITAYDGEAGLQKAQEIKPDLILLDIIMPKMNGDEVSKRIISDPQTKEIPIIMFTASTVKDLEEKCRELGIAHFLTKPFETNQLLNIVNKILRGD